MTLTDRDKKIVIALIPVVVLAGLLVPGALAPARGGRPSSDAKLTQVEGERDDAQTSVDQLENSRDQLRAGLLDGRAPGQGDPVDAGHAQPAGPARVAPPRAPRSTSTASPWASASSRPARPARPTPPLLLRPARPAPVVPAGPQTGLPARQPRPPTRRRTPPTRPHQPAGRGRRDDRQRGHDRCGSDVGASPGWTAVPLNFTFTGSYFDLADFFHRVKRFVRVADGRHQRRRPAHDHRRVRLQHRQVPDRHRHRDRVGVPGAQVPGHDRRRQPRRDPPRHPGGLRREPRRGRARAPTRLRRGAP